MCTIFVCQSRFLFWKYEAVQQVSFLPVIIILDLKALLSVQRLFNSLISLQFTLPIIFRKYDGEMTFTPMSYLKYFLEQVQLPLHVIGLKRFIHTNVLLQTETQVSLAEKHS